MPTLSFNSSCKYDVLAAFERWIKWMFINYLTFKFKLCTKLNYFLAFVIDALTFNDDDDDDDDNTVS